MGRIIPGAIKAQNKRFCEEVWGKRSSSVKGLPSNNVSDQNSSFASIGKLKCNVLSRLFNDRSGRAKDGPSRERVPLLNGPIQNDSQIFPETISDPMRR